MKEDNSKKDEWIVIDYRQVPNKLLCERCKMEQELPRLTQLDVFIAMIKAFRKIHRKCKMENKK